MTLNQKIGESVRSRRLKLGMTQKRLAELLGVHRPAISEIEMGRRRLSAPEIRDLTILFGCTFEELTGEKNE